MWKVNPEDDNVIKMPSRKFVRFWPEHIECDFCGALTRGRVYEDSAEVSCGACHSVMYEFPLIEPYIEFIPECEEEDGEAE